MVELISFVHIPFIARFYEQLMNDLLFLIKKRYFYHIARYNWPLTFAYTSQ